MCLLAKQAGATGQLTWNPEYGLRSISNYNEVQKLSWAHDAHLFNASSVIHFFWLFLRPLRLNNCECKNQRINIFAICKPYPLWAAPWRVMQPKHTTLKYQNAQRMELGSTLKSPGLDVSAGLVYCFVEKVVCRTKKVALISAIWHHQQKTWKISSSCQSFFRLQNVCPTEN